MEEAAINDRQRAWDAYWSTGELHSCVGSYGGNYAGAVAAFWNQRFACLKAGARVLDLATGNGALPLLLLRQVGSAPCIAVDAVDLAAIAPVWPDPETRSLVNFQSRVSMESLPFDDATFDLVVSQYGLEYASWPAAVDEAMRVCKSSGTAAFVVHHAGSVLVEVGRHELGNQALLTSDEGLLAAAAGVLPWMARARAGDAAVARDPRAAASRARYNQAMATLAAAIEASPVPDLLVHGRDHVHAILGLSASADPSHAPAALQQYRQALEAAGLRTSEMIAHALDQSGIDAMRAAIVQGRPGCRFTAEPIVQEQGVLGWGVVVQPGLQPVLPQAQ